MPGFPAGNGAGAAASGPGGAGYALFASVLRRKALLPGGPEPFRQGRAQRLYERLALRAAPVHAGRNGPDAGSGGWGNSRGGWADLPERVFRAGRQPLHDPAGGRRASPPGLCGGGPVLLRLRPRLRRLPAGFLPPVRSGPAAAPMGAGQLVEPFLPLYRGKLSGVDGKVRREKSPLVGGGHRHGLASDQRALWQRLDGLHMEPGAVPRPAPLPAGAPRPGDARDTESSSRRGRAAPRGSLRKRLPGAGPGSGKEAGRGFRRGGRGVPAGLSGLPASSAGRRRRGFLVDRLAAGEYQRHSRTGSSLGAQRAALSG